MNSFPPLIPVPVSPGPSKSEPEDQLEAKFATLFSPPTPRASPDLPSDFIFKSPTRPIVQYQAPSSPDSEFGSFISVPPSEDPLAVSFSTLASDSQNVANVANPPPSRPGHTKNFSLSFFDDFAQEAKAAQERNKRDVMDELLSGDLNWSQKSTPRDDSKADVNPESLLDLDLDFFTPKHETPPEDVHYISHAPSPVKTPSPPQLRGRQSTLSLAEPAPPVASMSSVSSSPPNENGPENDSMTHGRSPSSSYQTLSNISSRWMSTLRKPPGAASDSSSANSGSEFSEHSTITHTRSQSSSDSQSRHLRHTQTFPFPAATSLASSLSSSFTSSLSLPPTISSHHTSVRGAHHPSPFAPHIFVAPSGAPGFKPDGYDWDKGYSRELDRELAAENELMDTTVRTTANAAHVSNDSLSVPAMSHASLESSSTSPSSSQPHSRSQTPSPKPPTGMGGLIEKRTGNLELKGRREATAAVLNVGLAEMIRAQLPALARLPRSWNLLYSLDQHGISLHTLYDKCENQPQLRTGSGFATKVGALVIMKDSGDALFGVYMGDGVRQSKGKGYYGSGESFLWRYVNGNFQVFKWTGKNEYVAHCEPEYLSFGGGDGAYGLYLDESLFDGSSARCPTFDNEPLCSPGDKRGRDVSFECVGLEVWSVGP
ncbi:hypothetical protein GYMLUDRAFT_50101 [Collybiopsis luxurians FD-317 M1]|uniref:Oxidation resistance protein 1 n=1 Tax=Collybiopsis luxurians FD-317 M1 TaxID=944289 RepID=A0A0D0C2I2_9AGAR|nr:hypothetical protein GYMLUDRAFT_50101 [Collybiopsis luxurians FD-317 M1]